METVLDDAELSLRECRTDVDCLGQERIIEKKGRGGERETTTHLIKFPLFIHASRVTIFRYDYDARIRMYVVK